MIKTKGLYRCSYYISVIEAKTSLEANQMNKNELIQKVKHLNPLRSMTSWNKLSVEELQELYDDFKKIDNAQMTEQVKEENVLEIANEYGDNQADEAIEEAEHLNDSQYEG